MKTRRDFTTFAALSAITATFGPAIVQATSLHSADTSSASKEPAMANPDLAEFYNRYINALNARDAVTVENMIHEEVLRLGVPYPRDGVMESFKVITEAVPDYRWNIQDLFVVDDRIAVRLQNTGTPIKTFVGHDPTGRSVNFMEFASYRIRDGRFAEMWFLMDEVTVAKQLKGAQ